MAQGTGFVETNERPRRVNRELRPARSITVSLNGTEVLPPTTGDRVPKLMYGTTSDDINIPVAQS